MQPRDTDGTNGYLFLSEPIRKTPHIHKGNCVPVNLLRQFTLKSLRRYYSYSTTS
jgi:hypothetical protein